MIFVLFCLLKTTWKRAACTTPISGYAERRKERNENEMNEVNTDNFREIHHIPCGITCATVTMLPEHRNRRKSIWCLVCVVCASTSACVPPLFAAHADVYCFIIETFKTYNLKQFICTRRIWPAIIRHTSNHHRNHSCRLCVTMPTFNGTIQSANETITKNCTCVNCFFPFFRSF